MSDWFGTGFDASDEMSTFETKAPRRHWQPPQSTHRLLFLEDDPTVFFEHNFKLNGNWRNYAVCRRRNKGIGDTECELCTRYPDKNAYPVGMFSVIDFTEWEYKNKTYCYNRRIFAGRFGSEDRPGTMRELRRLKERHGRMRGLVFDVFRSGAKTESCGDKFELVEKIDSSEIVAYGHKKLEEFVGRLNKNLEPDKRLSVDQLWKSNPWEPIDIPSVNPPKTNSELRSMLSGERSESKSSSDDFSDADDFSDVPY